jgi:hypothetical protein
VLGGRAILHARCHSCGSNLLAEVLEFEQEVERSKDADVTAEKPIPDDPPTGEYDEDDLLAELESA